MSSYIGVRQATIIPVFLSFIVNLVSTWLATKSKHKITIERMQLLHKRIIPFGFGGLLACNLIQGGVFHAVVAWVAFILIGFMHFCEFYDAKNIIRKIVSYCYFFTVIVWFMGIIISYSRLI